MNLAIIFSLLFHAAVLSYTTSMNINNNNRKKKSQQEQRIQIKLKQEQAAQPKKGQDEDLDIHVIKDLFEKLEKLQEEENFINQIMNKPCDKFYFGIGITHNTVMQEISYVAPGGPAHQAGIQVGDMFLNSHPIKNVYPEGTIINVEILRNGIIHSIPVKIGKICTTYKR